MSDPNQALAVIYPKSLEPIRDIQCMGQSKEELIRMTLNVLKSAHSKRAYRRALNDFLDWYLKRGRPPLKKAILQEYRADLEAAGAEAKNINQRLCAIHRMIREAAANKEIDEQAARSAAAVEGIGTPGKSVGVWLTKEPTELFINCIDRSTLVGERDFALICLFLTSGLRRSERANLRLEDIQQTAGRWVLLGVVGK